MEIGEIEKKIPVPKPRVKKYFWEGLSVGDSILIPVGKDESINVIRNRVSKSIHKYSRKTGKKLHSASIQEDHAIKVWRTE